ncbi:unnamed protein product [Orchesella dallaii]|uniref:Uncharacterized protein n=1 Tax=Orchesella dallaii TaxID=48710 RepID=A0ABP1PTD7_9HEXA
MENCIFCTSSVLSNYKKLADGKVKPRRMRSERVSQIFSPVGPPRLSFDTQDNFLAVEGHLKTFFVLIKVLTIPHEKLSEFIGFEEGANHPELWVNVCESCKPLVQEFYEIEGELSKRKRKAKDATDLEERLTEIQRSLKGEIFDSRNKKCENYIWEQIREHVLQNDVMEKKTSSAAARNPLAPSVVSSSTTPVSQRESSPAVVDVIPLNEDREDERQIQTGDLEPHRDQERRRLLNEKFHKINNEVKAKARENIKCIKTRAAKNGYDFNASSFSLVWKELKVGDDSDGSDDDEGETVERSQGRRDEDIEASSDSMEEQDSGVENSTLPVIVHDSNDNGGGRRGQTEEKHADAERVVKSQYAEGDSRGVEEIDVNVTANKDPSSSVAGPFGITLSVPRVAELRRSKRRIVRRRIS